MKIFPVLQVSSLLPLLTYSELEQVTSTTVPVSTGNCVVVSIVMLVHSVFSPVQEGAAVEVFLLSVKRFWWVITLTLSGKLSSSKVLAGNF